MVESLKQGRIVPVQMHASIAEGLHGLPQPDAITFPYIQKYIEMPVLLISEAEIKQAMGFMLEAHKMVMEASSVVGVAAVTATRYAHLFARRKVAIIITGGNVDWDLIHHVVSAYHH
eukprot:TRINITY_DN2827_c0_g1_i3.p2 TRINITY_DN2827_c0_g1~~TRINITY_DN2827_c0_g1_i3.p2  ORF type:complete len:117 (-),score=34.52 TRINITY_DN2827_c0_g1_i3:75-425(-)